MPDAGEPDAIPVYDLVVYQPPLIEQMPEFLEEPAAEPLSQALVVYQPPLFAQMEAPVEVPQYIIDPNFLHIMEQAYMANVRAALTEDPKSLAEERALADEQEQALTLEQEQALARKKENAARVQDLLKTLAPIHEAMQGCCSAARPGIEKVYRSMEGLVHPRKSEADRYTPEEVIEKAGELLHKFKCETVKRLDHTGKAIEADCNVDLTEAVRMADAFLDQHMSPEKRAQQRKEEAAVYEENEQKIMDDAVKNVRRARNRANDHLFRGSVKWDVTEPDYQLLYDEYVRLKAANAANTATNAEKMTLATIEATAKTYHGDVFKDRGDDLVRHVLTPLLTMSPKFKSLRYRIEIAFKGKIPEEWESLYGCVKQLSDMDPDTKAETYNTALSRFLSTSKRIASNKSPSKSMAAIYSQLMDLEDDAEDLQAVIGQKGLVTLALNIDKTKSFADDFNSVKELSHVIGGLPRYEDDLAAVEKAMKDTAEWAKKTLDSRAVRNAGGSPAATALKASLTAISKADGSASPMKVASHIATVAATSGILKLYAINSDAADLYSPLLRYAQLPDITASLDVNRRMYRDGTGIFSPAPKQAVPEKKNTEKAVPEKENTEKAVPEKENTEKAVPEKENTEKAVPEKENTEKAVPEKENTEKAVPEKKNTEKAV
ncbi:MAG: hypothetical protein IKI21_10680, partial [Oscillospiraceae bacterium]|nr:hypothetical protein [Oscillospiraceae bacterium]